MQSKRHTRHSCLPSISYAEAKKGFAVVVPVCTQQVVNFQNVRDTVFLSKRSILAAKQLLRCNTCWALLHAALTCAVLSRTHHTDLR